MPFSTDKKKPCKATPPCGPVFGISRRGISAYKGIPYGKPPIGQRRFKKPEPADAWKEIIDCSLPGDSAMQMGGIIADTQSSYTMEKKSEDCLFLNVWTPEEKTKEKLPVYVFIHGGGFSTGSGSEIIYDGARMAMNQVVVVTINYRLGALGFLATHALLEESGSTGNYGILDQILALKWVKQNIEAFGGDPQSVTVGGESAGAFSVTGLLLSPLAKGLFHQAIIESGSILSIPAFSSKNRGDLKKTLSNGESLCQFLGIQDTIEDLEKLRQIPGDLFAALSMVKSDQTMPPHNFSFWPVFDGVVLPKDPMEALRTGNFNPAKILIGYNTNESSLFIKGHTNLGIYQMLCYEIFGAKAGQAVLEHFAVTDKKTPLFQLREIYTHVAFLLGMTIFAKHYAEQHHPVFFYNFDYDPAILKIIGLDTTHAMELPFVFGNGIGQRRATKISNLSFIMQQSWMQFIKTGDPNLEEGYPGNLRWPKFSLDKKELMVFDSHLSTKPLPNQDDLSFLKKIMFNTDNF